MCDSSIHRRTDRSTAVTSGGTSIPSKSLVMGTRNVVAGHPQSVFELRVMMAFRDPDHAILVILILAQSRMHCPKAKRRPQRRRSYRRAVGRCWLIAGERRARRYVPRTAFDAEWACLGARAMSMLWPSAAADGPAALGRLPPALKRAPRALRSGDAASEPGPDRLLRPQRSHRKVQPPAVLHWGLPEQRRRHPRDPEARRPDARYLDTGSLGRSPQR